jgi:hypothetical protein
MLPGTLRKPAPAAPSPGPWVAATAVAVALGFLALRPIGTPDFWWHLSMGRATVEAGSPLFSDPVAAAATARYVNIVWLYDVGLYGLYGAGGLVAVNAILGLLAAASFLLCWAVARDIVGRRAPWMALALATLAAGGAHVRMLPRPDSVFFVLLPLVLWLARRGATTRGLSAWRYRGGLLLSVAAWAQVHASVVIAPAVAIGASLPWCWPSGEPRRASPPRGHVAVLVATALLPLTGASGVGLVGRVLAHDDNYVIRVIAEMKPLSVALWQSFEPDVVVVKVLLLLALVGLVRRPRLPVGALLLAGLGGLLAWNTNRFVATWCVLLLPLVCELWRPAKGEREGWRSRLGAIAATVGVVTLLARGSAAPSFEPGAEREMGPARAVVALGLDGTIFNSYDDGGLLGWQLYGRPRVVIDSRSQMRFELEENYAALRALRDPEAFRALHRLHGFAAALVPSLAPLCRTLAAESRWRPVWRSERTTIFLPRTAGAKEDPAALQALPACGESFPPAGCGRPEAARSALAEVDALLALTPGEAALGRIGARVALQCSRPPAVAAAADYVHLASGEPGHQDLPWLRGLLLLAQTEPEAALRTLAAASADHVPAAVLRLQILRHLGRPREALPLARELVVRTERAGFARGRELLAWACRETGDEECSVREALRAALAGDISARQELRAALAAGRVPPALHALAAAATEATPTAEDSAPAATPENRGSP